MMFAVIRKILCLSFVFGLFYSNLFSAEYDDIIKKIYSNRALDSIEGIWVKTFANQGPPGCVTMFYKENDKYYQIHIDNCFVMGKVTGKHTKISTNQYQGENAVYFYNGAINWEPSAITIATDLKTFSITHGSYNFSFKEDWKRIWPENIKNYNNSIK